MSAKQKPTISFIVALCGIMSGLALVMMFFLSMIPSFEYISPAVSGILIWVIRERLGVKYGIVSYIAVGILCLFLTPNYEASLMYIFLLGYYPIVREFLMKLPTAVLRLFVKLAVYSVSAIVCYWLLINLFNMTQLLEDMGDFGEYGPWILLAMGAVAFLLYDLFLGLFRPFYEQVMKPKIQKRMK